MTTNSDLGGSDLNANLTATTKPYITGCNDKYKTVTVVNTLASLMLKYQAELELAIDSLTSSRNAESISTRRIFRQQLIYIAA